jgi:DNA-binding NtrC family response regulator
MFRSVNPVTLIGVSAAIRELRGELERAAHLDVDVLFAGEPGVGKKFMARLVHQHSRRCRRV